MKLKKISTLLLAGVMLFLFSGCDLFQLFNPGEISSVTSVAGTIYMTDEDNAASPLSNASVTATDEEGNISATTATSDSGEYVLNLSAGTYVITVELEGYETISQTVSLSEGNTQTLDFEMSANSPELTAEEMYAEILDLFYENILSNWADYRGTTNYGSEIISYLFYWVYADPPDLDAIGYSFVDLDENGVPELIIGMDSGGEYTNESMIYDLYTYVQGEVVHLATSGERFWYKLCEDNTIYYYGTSGAASNNYAHYSLEKGADALSALECVRSAPDDTWENTYWYYSTSDFYADDEVQISEENANALVSSWPQAVQLELTPFREYASGEEQQTYLSEEEAIAAAYEYFNLTPGAADEETGWNMTIFIQNTPNNTDSRYLLSLAWLVDGDHWSTLDWVYVDGITGECISYW